VEVAVVAVRENVESARYFLNLITDQRLLLKCFLWDVMINIGDVFVILNIFFLLIVDVKLSKSLNTTPIVIPTIALKIVVFLGDPLPLLLVLLLPVLVALPFLPRLVYNQ
jgi:hypothetical protein